MYRLIGILFLIFIKQFSVFPQTGNTSQKINKIHLKKGYAIYFEDKVVVAHNDTTIFLPTNIDFYIRHEASESDEIYKQIENTAYKNKWTKRLHNIVLAPSVKKPVKDTLQTQKGEIPFLPYSNLIIRKITLEKLDVFGPTVSNPDQPTSNWIGQVGNKLHINTLDRVIYNNILFKTGDCIDPYTMADNERILRQLSFIEDARIQIKNVSSEGDSADVLVIVKDVWSIGFDADLHKVPDGHLDLWDKNLFGTGHENDFFYNWESTGKPASEFNGYYQITNLAGTFINSKIGYDVYGSKGFSVDLWRDFFTQRTKYAGELDFEDLNTYNDIVEFGQPDYYAPIQYNKTNFWMGRAFPILKNRLNATTRANIIPAVAVYSIYYSVRPFVTDQTLYDYHNKTYLLASIAYSSQGYYKSNLIYSFGKTEDIPYGSLVKLTEGIEKDEFFNRLYSSVKLSEGNYISNLGYQYASIAFGGFLYKNDIEQGMLELNTNFFTNLLVLRQFKFRHFISCNYMYGYHRFLDERITINDPYGITGFNDNSVNGTQRLTVNLQTVSFTPYYLLGFRFAVFGYADLGLIGNSSKSIFDNPLYSGLGIGIRLRNEKLVFNTFQIRFAFYPLLHDKTPGELFTLSNETPFQTSDFYAKSPEILEFK